MLLLGERMYECNGGYVGYAKVIYREYGKHGSREVMETYTASTLVEQ